jgi:hypothetical protein
VSVFYFSGIEKAATAQALVREQASGMMSQLLYNPQLLDACATINLVMDSGAYSKMLEKKDIEEYASLISILGERCTWYANADVIGNQEQSNANYFYLLSLLPEQLHSRILWIYQYGSDVKYLYQGLVTHQRIGIGGLVPLLKDRQRATAIITSLAREIAAYPVVPHYFGLSTYSIIQALHTYHDDFSVDSTTWLAGGKYGLLINNQGIQRPAREGGYDFDTESILRQNVRTMRKWVEGVSVKKPKGAYLQMTLEGVA